MSKTQSKTGRSALIVLGMHRSGTSALAGVLNLLGCDMPATLMVPNADNEKGYFESSKLYKLHTDLFASAATRWDDWLPMPAGWFDGPRAGEFRERASETMTAEFGRSSFFLLKDPRICRLMPFWEGVLAEQGITPRYVLTHRNPLEVAASLHKRNGLSTGHGLLIWLRHVLEAEYGTRGKPRCFTSFVQLMTNWAGVADKIQAGLSLNLPRFSLGAAPEIDSFLEGSLRHHHEAPEKVLNNPMLSPWVRDTYEILERWVFGGEEPGDHARLDAIRTAFDASGPAFAEAIQSGRSQVERLSGEIDALKEEKASVSVRVNELRVGVARREEIANQLRTEVTETKERISELEAASSASNSACTALEKELDALRLDLASREKALQASKIDTKETRQALEALKAEVGAREAAHTAQLEERDRELRRLEAERDAQAAKLDQLENRLAQEQSALEQRSHEADQTRQALEALKAEVGAREAAHTAQLEERDRELRRLEAERDAQAAKLDQLENRLAQEQSALEQRSHEADQTHKALEALQAELDDREQAHAALLLDQEAAAEEVGRLTEAVTVAEARLRDREALHRGQVANKTEQVQSLEATLKGQYRELAEMTRILATKEAEIEQERKVSAEMVERERKNALQTLEHERQNSRETLERERSARVSSDARVSALDNQLQTQFREMAELSRLLAQSEQALTAARVQAQTDLAAMRARLGEEEGRAAETRTQLEAQTAEAQERAQFLAEEIAALRASKSWRITQPLRSVIDWMRGSRP